MGKPELFLTSSHAKAKWKEKSVTAIAKKIKQNSAKHLTGLSTNCAINVIHDVATSTEEGKWDLLP